MPSGNRRKPAERTHVQYTDSLSEAIEISAHRPRYNLTMNPEMTARVRAVAKVREVETSQAAYWLLKRALDWWDNLPDIQKEIA